MVLRELKQEPWFCFLLTTNANKQNAGILSKGMEATASHSNYSNRESCSLLYLQYQDFNRQNLSEDTQVVTSVVEDACLALAA